MKTPPLAGIRAFETAARHQNFRKAAAELGMTATAVSQHVKALEDWLGTALFERGARGVTLTRAGEELGASVTAGLGQIDRSALQIRDRAKRTTVRLACLPSVVSHWLAPRLSDFRAAHPHIEVSISYAAEARTPAAAGADLLIQHGNMPDNRAHAILSAATRPTCSPLYLARKGPFAAPADLAFADLLHDETPSAWQRWFTEGGVDIAAPSGPIFADFNLLLSSLTSGLGIGLCPSELIARDLSEGRLIVLFERPNDADKIYWLAERERLTPEAALMRDWLVAQAGQAPAMLPVTETH
ncbi:MAG: LysR substrate-binding domain-containing protein [Neorhizobium sp.]|nr:LysR substrate-binding domain-containing protein [Neorhizobium sp.]